MPILIIRFKFLPLTETFNYDELKYLLRYRPYVFCHVRKNRHMFPYDRFVPGGGDGCKALWSELLHDYFIPSFLKRINTMRNLDLVEKFISMNKIRVVHAHFFDEMLFAVELKERIQFKLVVTFHGGKDLCAFQALAMPARMRAIDAVDTFIVKAEYMRQILIGLGVSKDKICVFHRGVDTDFWAMNVKEGACSSKELPQIAFVGRCLRKKGVLDLLHAIKALDGVRWVLVLSAEMLAARFLRFVCQFFRYGRMEVDLFLPEYIKIWLWLRNKYSVSCVWNISAKKVRARMSSANMVVVPSIKTPQGAAEGIPRVLLEAQSLGKPVVAYDSGGSREGLVDQKTGFLVREGDCEGLISSIKVLMDQEVSARMGLSARLFIQKNFSIQKNIEVLEKIYDA